MNVRATFNGNPSNSNMSHKTTKVNLGKRLEGSPKPAWFILWGPWISVQNVMAIHPVVVAIFQSGPKRWMDLLTNIRHQWIHFSIQNKWIISMLSMQNAKPRNSALAYFNILPQMNGLQALIWDLGLQDALRSHWITLEINGWWPKRKGAFSCFLFLESWHFRDKQLHQAVSICKTTHHGIVTANASNSHQHVSRYDSPLCTSKEITHTYKTLRTHTEHGH